MLEREHERALGVASPSHASVAVAVPGGICLVTTID